MDEKITGAEELALEPRTEEIEEAQKIAELSLQKEKHSFIVKYDPNEEEFLLQVLEKLKCDIETHLDFANCMAVSMDYGQIGALKSINCIEMVEKNYDYNMLLEESALGEEELVKILAGEKPENSSLSAKKQGLGKAVDITAALSDSQKESKGKGVKIAVLDTGISPKVNIPVKSRVSFIDTEDEFEDINGHGTKIAGIIAYTESEKGVLGAVSEAEIHSVKVANSRGFATTATIMAGINWAIENGINIVNMSFGAYSKSYLLEKMIEKAHKYGIIMVAAVGNDGTFADEHRIMYPAAYKNVVAVGAGSEKGLESFSNSGDKLDFVAPGRMNTIDAEGNISSIVGTSASCAYVTGAFAEALSVDESADVVTSLKATKTTHTDKAVEAEGTTLTKMEENAIINTENTASYPVAETVSVLREAEVTALSDGGVSPKCVPGSSSGSCDCSNTMATAIPLTLNNWKSGYISCVGSFVWYKFTTNDASYHPNGNNSNYTITSSGYLDTYVTLYDSNGNVLASDDDSGDDLNFRLSRNLEYDRTYYLKLGAYGIAGEFDIIITNSSTLINKIGSVTIKKDGNFNKVVFNSTGKVWNCINNDMIFDDVNKNDTILRNRANHNYYVRYDETNPIKSDTTVREYTDDEIKLLYAIDPYGVAAYVQRYAVYQCDGLVGNLGYKDRIFRLLFKREPKYFARDYKGEWYETQDLSDLGEVLSESESLFGMHQVWDDYTTAQLIKVAAGILHIVITVTCNAPKVVAYLEYHKTVDTIVKILSFTVNTVSNGFISAVADEFIEEAFEKTSLSWAYNIVSVYSSLNDIVQRLDFDQTYYRQIFDHCINDICYEIYMELKSGQTYTLYNIQEALITG